MYNKEGNIMENVKNYQTSDFFAKNIGDLGKMREKTMEVRGYIGIYNIRFKKRISRIFPLPP